MSKYSTFTAAVCTLTYVTPPSSFAPHRPLRPLTAPDRS